MVQSFSTTSDYFQDYVLDMIGDYQAKPVAGDPLGIWDCS